MFLRMYVILCTVFKLSQSLNCSKANEICVESTESCETCIQSHPCCDWCFMPDFSKPRCNNKLLLETSGCDRDFIYYGGNSNIKTAGTQNKSFSDPDTNIDEAIVQIMPQRLRLQLRLNQPITFQLLYKAAKNYPLDLYYLMDLTYSMRNDINTVMNLGSNIPQHLENLTKNYKIAFGYYSDKVVMPFSFMTAEDLRNPCYSQGQSCKKGYNFVHSLDFTETIDDFIKKVNSSEITANIDDLEGATDAIMQILACKNYIGWRKYSRKIIVVATDGSLHFAGDGLLAGITNRNSDFTCLLDANGTYEENSLKYDYPSLEEIYRKLVQNKVNVLFAAKDLVYEYYRQLNKVIPHISYVGKLEMKSENVLQLIDESYTNVVRNVMFRVNETAEVDFTFTTSCNKPEFTDNWNSTSSCDNIKIGDQYTFNVTVELKKIPPRNADRFVIEELNIAEDVIIDVEYLGTKCSCHEEEEGVDCGDGKYECGKCLCNPGWTGKNCEILCNGENICRFKNVTYTSSTCYNHGECDLDTCKCICDYDYTGEYCQYKQCKRNKETGKICSGDSQGTCIQGTCHCEPGFGHDDCSCRLSNATCFAPGYKEPCNGVGKCECGRCTCSKGYSGAFCEYCATCTKECEQYLDCILDTVNGKATDYCSNNESIYYTQTTDNIEDNQTLCIAINEKDGIKCKIEFTYKFKRNELDNINVYLHYVENPCSKPLAASTVGFVIIGSIILLGGLVLLIWKRKVMHDDNLKMQKFLKERDNSKWSEEQNPLYNSPIRKYFNPMDKMEMKDMH